MATITALGIGSGLDLTGLLDQLEAAERQKLVPIAQQKQSYQSKISAYGVLQNALNQFQTAADKLKDGQLFSAVKSSVTGSSVTAASSSDAAAGVYQVNVERLATHYSVATEGVDDKSKPLGAGTISFTFPGAEGEGGSAKPVVIEEGKTSLEDIRNAINAADIGVSASIVNDGQPGAAGDLLGDAALRNVQSQLRREMGDIMGGIQVGDTLERPITLQLKGDLKIDEEKLEALVNSNPGALADFFAGATGDKGFASKLSDALELMTRDGGVIDNAKKGLQTSIASLDTRYARMEQSIDASIARYRSQFAQLDSMIASMNSTSAYLTQQFDMMNAQLGNGRR